MIETYSSSTAPFSVPMYPYILRCAVMAWFWLSSRGGGGGADAFSGVRRIGVTASSSSSAPRWTRNRRRTIAIPTKALQEGLSPNDYFGDPATIAATRVINAEPTTTVPANSESKNRNGKVQRLQSLAEFLDVIDSAPTYSLVVIKFFGNSCPLCRKIEMKYKKMAHYYSPAPIQFAEIESKVHPELFRTLGIDTFPHIQIYRNGQCVASHGTERDTTFEPMVKDTIDRELCMTLDDWNAFLTVFATPIQASTDQLNRLRTFLDSSSASTTTTTSSV